MTYRFRGDTPPTASSRASVLTPEVTDHVAEMFLYDPIDSWGGPWGVSAKEFADALAQLPEGVTEIRLHINSPGGEVWDAMAIVNQLRRHDARVVAVVDGVAASAASIVAVTADETIMGIGAQMMVHDAWNVAIGNEADMLAMATRLGKSSDTLAGIYATKAGGSAQEWREVMRDETWYSAIEAVEAGLADSAVGGDADDSAKALAAVPDGFPLFRYGGRAQAPAPRMVARSAAPQIPVSTEPGTTIRKESDMSDTLKAGLRDRLGITDAEADEAAILTALDEALEERAEPTTDIPEGTVLMDAKQLDELRAQAAEGAQARAQQVAERRDTVVAAAVADGRISPANRDSWRARMDENEEGTYALLATLAPNKAIPVEPIGFTGGPDEIDALDQKVAGLFTKEA